jgi:serine/threonine-protein kinase
MGEAQAGERVGNKYRLLRLLGEGGMGSVWVALHEPLRAEVALKFMHRQQASDPEARARFEREARAAARIRGEHVVHVLDHGMHDGVPFLVMELLEGEPLSEVLHREGTLDAAVAIELLRQIARGLQRAHDQDVVHRDLKPSNVFLCDSETEGVKLLDFGVAKRLGSARDAITATGNLLGTPRYMSPEQARGGEVDSRTDVWALSVIAYRMILGQYPFEGDGLPLLLSAILHGKVVAPSERWPEAPEALDAVMARAFRRDVRERFATAGEFVTAFEHALEEAPMVSQDLRARSVAEVTTKALVVTQRPATIEQAPNLDAVQSGGHPAAQSVIDDPPAPDNPWRLGFAIALGLAIGVVAIRSISSPAPWRSAAPIPEALLPAVATTMASGAAPEATTDRNGATIAGDTGNDRRPQRTRGKASRRPSPRRPARKVAGSQDASAGSGGAASAADDPLGLGGSAGEEVPTMFDDERTPMRPRPGKKAVIFESR